mmetsp:Transcript_62837/g.152988  ORF Transcript_62837/g.152988 Transcript_62837/m.152988 type:complete len:101 (-) Transcript_62837:56-358(-)
MFWKLTPSKLKAPSQPQFRPPPSSPPAASAAAAAVDVLISLSSSSSCFIEKEMNSSHVVPVNTVSSMMVVHKTGSESILQERGALQAFPACSLLSVESIK